MNGDELKEAFVVSNSKSVTDRNKYNRVFKALKVYEDKLDKDLCLFSEKELIEAISSMMISRRGTIISCIYVVNKYIEWCFNNGYTIVDPSTSKLSAKDIDISMYSNVKDKYVSSAKHLAMEMDRVFDPEESDTVSNVLRAYLWFGFMGIKEEDALSIRMSDVNMDSMIVSVGGEDYYIDALAAKCISKCIKLKTFNVFRGNTVMVRDRCDGDLLLRLLSKGDGNDGKPSKTSTMRKRTETVIAATDPNCKCLTYSRVALSGLFCNLLQVEPLAEITTKMIADSFKEKSKSRTVDMNKAKNILDDYRVWKELYYK